MRLDDHRAAGGQRRRGIAAGDAEREREVARTEDHHRADRIQDAAQVRPRRAHRPGRVAVIDPHTEVGALVEDLGEEFELEGGAPQFTTQPRLGQMGLPDTDRHQGLHRRFEPPSDLAQRRRTDRSRGDRPPIGCRGGGGHQRPDLLQGGLVGGGRGR